jgi:hypothetical protein
MERPGGWDAETVDDALDVLQDLVLWELVPERWDQVDHLLTRIAQAFAAGDADELRQTLADLELSGPVRALRIGGTPVNGIPEPVLDRRNTLVHNLSQERRRPPAEGGHAGHPPR